MVMTGRPQVRTSLSWATTCRYLASSTGVGLAVCDLKRVPWGHGLWSSSSPWAAASCWRELTEPTERVGQQRFYLSSGIPGFDMSLPAEPREENIARCCQRNEHPLQLLTELLELSVRETIEASDSRDIGGAVLWCGSCS